jgi:hypothetical protein
MTAKATSRRSQRKAIPSQQHSGESSQLGTGLLSAKVGVIRASGGKRPRQQSGPIQYVQAKILGIYPDLPESFNSVHLTCEVNEQLARDPNWLSGYGKKRKEVSRQTVLRAVKLLRKP